MKSINPLALHRKRARYLYLGLLGKGAQICRRFPEADAAMGVIAKANEGYITAIEELEPLMVELVKLRALEAAQRGQKKAEEVKLNAGGKEKKKGKS